MAHASARETPPSGHAVDGILVLDPTQAGSLAAASLPIVLLAILSGVTDSHRACVGFVPQASGHTITHAGLLARTLRAATCRLRPSFWRAYTPPLQSDPIREISS